MEVRAFFEAQWAENFAQSEVKYQMPTEVLTATTPVSLNPFADGNFGTDGTGVIGAGTPVAAGSRIGGGNHHNVADIVSSFVVPGGSGHGVSSHQNPHLQNKHQVVRNSSGSGGNLIVYAKGDNVFGTTVSKSFPRPSINGELVSGVDTVNISIASYRVVEVRIQKNIVWLVFMIILHLTNFIFAFLLFSPRDVGSMHNFTSFTARAAYETRRVCGNATRISKNCPKRLQKYMRAALP